MICEAIDYSLRPQSERMLSLVEIQVFTRRVYRYVCKS